LRSDMHFTAFSVMQHYQAMTEVFELLIRKHHIQAILLFDSPLSPNIPLFYFMGSLFYYVMFEGLLSQFLLKISHQITSSNRLVLTTAS
jgi:hypothetical protein